MIDNFDFVKSFIQCRNGNVYVIDIVIRGKDGIKSTIPRERIKIYYIKSVDFLMEKKQEIINMCEANLARAYIRANPINDMELLSLAAQAFQGQIELGMFRDPNIIISGVCDDYPTDNPIWVLDIDTKDEEHLNAVINLIDSNEGNHDWFIYQYPSKSGYHIICKPFNDDGMDQFYPVTSIMRNNGILLYLPKSISE